MQPIITIVRYLVTKIKYCRLTVIKHIYIYIYNVLIFMLLLNFHWDNCQLEIESHVFFLVRIAYLWYSFLYVIVKKIH